MQKSIAKLIVTTKITEYILDEVLENHPEIVYKAIVRLFDEGKKNELVI